MKLNQNNMRLEQSNETLRPVRGGGKGLKKVTWIIALVLLTFPLFMIGTSPVQAEGQPVEQEDPPPDDPPCHPQLRERAADAADPGLVLVQVRSQRQIPVSGHLIGLAADVRVQPEGLVNDHHAGPWPGSFGGDREIPGHLSVRRTEGDVRHDATRSWKAWCCMFTPCASAEPRLRPPA